MLERERCRRDLYGPHLDVSKARRIRRPGERERGLQVGSGAPTCPPGPLGHSQLILPPGCSLRRANLESVLLSVEHPVVSSA